MSRSVSPKPRSSSVLSLPTLGQQIATGKQIDSPDLPAGLSVQNHSQHQIDSGNVNHASNDGDGFHLVDAANPSSSSSLSSSSGITDPAVLTTAGPHFDQAQFTYDSNGFSTPATLPSTDSISREDPITFYNQVPVTLPDHQHATVPYQYNHPPPPHHHQHHQHNQPFAHYIHQVAANPYVSGTVPVLSSNVPGSQDNIQYQLSVTNLPFIVRWQELKDLVKKYIPAQSIARAEVYTHANDAKKSQGIGSIRVYGRDAALKVVEFLDGFEWHGRQISVQNVSPMLVQPVQPVPSYVSFAYPAVHQQPQVNHQEPIHSHAGSHVSQFGYSNGGVVPVVSSISPDFYSTTSATASSPPSVPVPLDYIKNRITTFTIQPVDKRKVFFGNIPFDTELPELQAYIESEVNVTTVNIVTNQDGQSKGFAIAIFASDKDAADAIEKFNGLDFQGRALTVRLDRYPESKPHNDAGGFYNPHSSHQAQYGYSSGYGNGDKKMKKKENGVQYQAGGHFNYAAVQPANGAAAYWPAPPPQMVGVPQPFQNVQTQFQGFQVSNSNVNASLPYRYVQADNPAAGSVPVHPQVQAQLQAQLQSQGQVAQFLPVNFQPQIVSSGIVPPRPPPHHHHHQVAVTAAQVLQQASPSVSSAAQAHSLQ
ncbi:hypothetical protein V1514DRAFT_337658 [Lipomyces japonicus]|uniref:uncharacterized protein n=1 Tax=Lipomyces japonicus TaxID=56871 RepID=UPI0034CFCB10